MPLSSRTSVQAREAIQRAYKELESAVSVTDASRFRETTIQDVQKTCRIIENELGARGLLRNMGRLEPLLKGLECYGKVVETLCQGTPFLPWIWAPIVTILKIGSDCISAFETLIRAYAKIGQSLTRFESLRRAFDNDVAFQDIVAVFYRDIVKFHGCAYKFVTANGWKTFFRTTWGRFERQFHAILESLDRHAELIDKEANARNIVDTQRLLKQLKAESENRLEQLHSEEKTRIAQYYRDVVARLQVNESDQVSIWETLVGAVPMGSEHTCDWVLQHTKIRSWLSVTGTTHLLWIQGTAGTGKSVLAAHLARFRSVNDHTVVRHFCNDLYDSSMKYDQILKSIVRQLAEQSDDAVAHIHDVLKNDRKPLTVSALEHIAKDLLTLITGSQKDGKDVWIIVDGIDICEPTDLTRCVSWLDSVATRDKKVGAGSCKILFTSRGQPPKRNARHRSLVTLGEEATSVTASIRYYTGRRLQLSPMAERLSQLGLDSEAVAQLAEEISRKADGMFLYARLIIDYLTKQLFRTSRELNDALHELPPELKGFYHKIVSNILSHLSPASIESVRCVLQWIGFSTVPLKKMELLSAVTFTLGDGHADRLVPSFFLHDCFALLEEKPDKTIAYLHATVKDFLLDTDSPLSLSKDSIKRQLTLGTLACLSAAAKVFGPHSSAESARLLTVRGVFALLNYSSNHWIEHVLSCAEECYKNSRHDVEFENAINSLACELYEVRAETGIQAEQVRKGLPAPDARAEYLQRFPAILPAIEAALASQSEVLEQNNSTRKGKTECRPEVYPAGDSVAAILKRYREAVLWVLTRGYFLGVSKEDFELFKMQAQTMLYTCRLPSCPRSLIGFETQARISAHELEHSIRHHCQAEGCQFPSFSSIDHLEKHKKKYHQRHAERRKLRRVDSIAPGTSAYFPRKVMDIHTGRYKQDQQGVPLENPEHWFAHSGLRVVSGSGLGSRWEAFPGTRPSVQSSHDGVAVPQNQILDSNWYPDTTDSAEPEFPRRVLPRNDYEGSVTQQERIKQQEYRAELRRMNSLNKERLRLARFVGEMAKVRLAQASEKDIAGSAEPEFPHVKEVVEMLAWVAKKKEKVRLAHESDEDTAGSVEPEFPHIMKDIEDIKELFDCIAHVEEARRLAQASEEDIAGNAEPKFPHIKEMITMLARLAEKKEKVRLAQESEEDTAGSAKSEFPRQTHALHDYHMQLFWFEEAKREEQEKTQASSG